MKFEWIEEGDGRYRVQFFDMDEKKVCLKKMSCSESSKRCFLEITQSCWNL